ncbi:MAG: hypothetical protein KF833_14415 [Verrucomicrobiae bacterium]|nr:hypothetical protein [Verrucomicrobiae bacterium]
MRQARQADACQVALGYLERGGKIRVGQIEAGEVEMVVPLDKFAVLDRKTVGDDALEGLEF